MGAAGAAIGAAGGRGSAMGSHVRIVGALDGAQDRQRALLLLIVEDAVRDAVEAGATGDELLAAIRAAGSGWVLTAQGRRVLGLELVPTDGGAA